MLLVLAVDALDYEYVEYFDVPALKLEQSRPIETFSYMKDQPYTLEVWPTVATGVGPEEHGITGGGTSEWDNLFLEVLSSFTAKLGGNTRDKLGNIAEAITGVSHSIPETDVNHVFQGEGRVVHNWPGIHNSGELKRVLETAEPDESVQTVEEFERELYGIAAEQFGWIREMINHELILAGCHVHTLDMCGHIYKEDKKRYRRTYQRVNDWVAEIRDRLDTDDDLLLVSDHGIHTSWGGTGVEPGLHSDRAMAATTMDKELFNDVYDAREWIEDAVNQRKISRVKIDVPTEQLEDLGYI